MSPLLFGCGANPSFEKTLDERWQWDGGVEASHVLSALDGASAPPRVPAAVGATGRGLVGRKLPDGKLWSYEGPVDVLPTLVGDVVIFSGDGVVTALDVASGQKKYAVKVNDRRLEGAGYDGKNSILLLVDSDDARQDQILVLGPAGQELYAATANARIGTPAAIGGIGLVPYSGQYVGALDFDTGKHIGRILIRDGLHSVETGEEGIILLGTGATLLSPALTSSPGSRSLKLKPRDLPGEPAWPIDGSKPRPVRSAPIGIYAYPETSEGTLRFSTGGYVASYYQVVIGLDQGSNELRFATYLPRAVAGGAPSPSGPTLCLENGAVVRVNAKTGHHIPFGSLESKIQACVVTSPSEAIPGGNRPTVLEQLKETISATGPDMVAIQKVLLEELGSNSSAKTTESLLAIAQDPLVSADLAKEAGRLLRTRKTGGIQIVRALVASAPETPSEVAKDDTPSEPKEAKPSDTPSDKAPTEPAIDSDARRREKLRPPPVGALAKALMRMKPKGAAAALAPYLGDPSLSAGSLRNIMEALIVLGTGAPEEIKHVSTFLYQYKNTGGEDALLDALVLAAHFLFKYGDDQADEKLQKDLSQSLTHPALTKKLKKSPPPRDDPPGSEKAPQTASPKK